MLATNSEEPKLVVASSLFASALLIALEDCSMLKSHAKIGQQPL